MPASALDFYRCQPPRWTFIGASIQAGLVSLPASALDFCYCQQSRWTFVISVDIVVDGQHPCWTCAFFSGNIVVDGPRLLLDLGFIFRRHRRRRPAHPAGLESLPASALSFSFWSADSFRGPKLIVSWTLLMVRRLFSHFASTSLSTQPPCSSIRAGLLSVRAGLLSLPVLDFCYCQQSR